MTNPEYQQFLHAHLVGTKLLNIEISGELCSFLFEGAALHIGSPWRLYDSRDMLSRLTKADIPDVLSRLDNVLVRSAAVKGIWNDIRLEFESKWILESFQDSLEYENWNLVIPSNNNSPSKMLIAGARSDMELFD